MVKWRTKKTAAAGAPAKSTEATAEKKESATAPEKGGGDAPAAEEVVISVPVHCEGCARKVRRSVQRLEGVDEVIVDCWTNTVVVRGRKALENPTMVVETVERRTGKKAVLLNPSPAKSPRSLVKETKKDAAEDMGKHAEEEDMEMVVVLRIDLHCDACSEEMKKRILNIEGVKEIVPHMKSSQVTVKGMVEPATLVGFIHKSTGRKAAIIRAEPLDPLHKAEKVGAATMEAETPADAERKQQDPSEMKEGVEEEKKGVQVENKEGGGEEDNVDEKLKMEKPNEDNGVEEEDVPNNTGNGVIEKNQTADHLFNVPVPTAVVAVDANGEKMAMNNIYQYYCHPAYPYAYPFHQYYPQQNPSAGNHMYGYPHYHPQTFSEENPDACNIM